RAWPPARADFDADADLLAPSAHGRPAALRRLDRLPGADRFHGRCGRRYRLRLPLVGRASASEVGPDRGPRVRRPDAPRTYARTGRADPGDGQGAGRAL